MPGLGKRGMRRGACGLALLALGACSHQPWTGPRPQALAPSAQSMALPRGYLLQRVAGGFDFPGAVAFDARGRIHVLEAGDAAHGRPPRLLRLDGDRHIELARGGRNAPWTGLAAARGAFFIAEGGQREGGRLLRLNRDGTLQTLVTGLPSYGDHPTRGPAIGPDGALYFGQGTATNAGVVGPDNSGWLRRFPEFHDRPCRELVLSGQNFRAADPGHGDSITGAFVRLGESTHRSQRLRAQRPCGGAVYRLGIDGGAPRLVAWGLRDIGGLAFSPAGRLHVAERSFEARGTRPVPETPDLLWALDGKTAWYGWPDYAGGEALDDARWRRPGSALPRPLLRTPPNPPPTPLARFTASAEPGGLDFSRRAGFGFMGDAFVSLSGEARVVRVATASGTVHDFLQPRKGVVPWRQAAAALAQPVDVRFSPDGSALYVVDAGRHPGSGALWRIVRAPEIALR